MMQRRRPKTRPSRRSTRMNAANLAWLWILLVLLLLALAALRIYMTLPEQELKKAKDPSAQFMVWVQAVFDVLAVCKLPMRASESPLAYAARLDAAGQLSTALKPLCEALSLMLYGKLVAEPGRDRACAPRLRGSFRSPDAPEKAPSPPPPRPRPTKETRF